MLQYVWEKKSIIVTVYLNTHHEHSMSKRCPN